MRVYSIFDRKMKEYGHLILGRNDDAMRRSVVESVQGSGSLLDKYPEDFDLMALADFEPFTGELVASSRPVFVENLRLIMEAYAREKQERASGAVRDGAAAGRSEISV